MKVLTTTIMVAALILATIVALWMGWFTKPATRQELLNHSECTEYSRDGSYCFRQPLDQEGERLF